jgi:WD40 repeat protein
MRISKFLLGTLVLFSLASNGGLNFISTVGQYIVTGGSDGAVRFFDVQFRIVSWLEDLQAGEVTSVSFAQQPIEPPTVATTPLGMSTVQPSHS